MLRKLMFGTLASVLALGVFAVPVSAAGSDLAWINGMPGRVDVCIGRNEIVSNLRYRRAAFTHNLTAGTYRYVIRRAATGTCNGTRLGVAWATIGGADDQTAVIWKPFRKVLIKVFDNDTSVEAGSSSVVYRHMAKAPVAVDVWLWEHKVRTSDLFPPTFDNIRRGTSSPKVDLRPGQFYIDTYHGNPTRNFWRGFWSRTDTERYIEVYLLGNTRRNTGVMSISQVGDVAPTP